MSTNITLQSNRNLDPCTFNPLPAMIITHTNAKKIMLKGQSVQ